MFLSELHTHLPRYLTAELIYCATLLPWLGVGVGLLIARCYVRKKGQATAVLLALGMTLTLPLSELVLTPSSDWLDANHAFMQYAERELGRPPTERNEVTVYKARKLYVELVREQALLELAAKARLTEASIDVQRGLTDRHKLQFMQRLKAISR